MESIDRVLKLNRIYADCWIHLTQVIVAKDARGEDAVYERLLLLRILHVRQEITAIIDQIARGKPPKKYIQGDEPKEIVMDDYLRSKEGSYSIRLADPSLDMFFGNSQENEGKIHKFIEFIEELKNIDLRINVN